MRFKLPDTLILLLIFILFFCGMTWIIPAGEFERTDKGGRSVVVPNTYQEVEADPAGFAELILAPIRGFQDSASIIVFIFMIAGAFGILNATGAISAGLQTIVRGGENRGKKWMIPMLTLLFSVAGATFGMSEEVLVFILITLPLSQSVGYDSFIGVGIPFLGAGAGFAGAFLNPFTIGIAQGIAQLQPFSGWEYRIFVWAIFTLAVILFLVHYARKIDKGVIAPYIPKQMKNSKDQSSDFTGRRKAIVLLFVLGLVILVFGVNQWGWYINEIAGLFLVLGVVTAFIGKMKAQETVDAFVEGASEMVKVCLVIGLARGMIIVASDGKIIDTMLNAMAGSVEGYPKVVAVELMLVMQSLLNFFLPSGSAQAALTMPIMSPLGDLVGISPQTTVLAFQFGDGISNMIIPTSGITMGVLTLAEIPYRKWLIWVWPLIVTFFVLAMLLLIPPVLFFSY